jgi:hypothetical protein
VTPSVTRAAGLVCTFIYASFIVWIYARQPATIAQVAGGVAHGLGTYQVDRRSFDEGLEFFRHDQFVEARAAFDRADPAKQDSRTQFYVAYSYYREGWGRLYHDDELYARGIEAIQRAVGVSDDGRVVVDDPGLQMHTADEVRAELERGRTRDLSDLNPLKLLRERK